MKKLKFFALALVAAFGFAACGDEDSENFDSATIVMGGSKSANGSFYTFSNGVQTKQGLTDNAAEANVVFCFSTLDENFKFISGSESANSIVKEACANSVTKFVEIGNATENKFEGADWTAAKTSIEISKKVEKGKNAIAFKNDKCQGFFEIGEYAEETEDLTLKIWIKK